MPHCKKYVTLITALWLLLPSLSFADKVDSLQAKHDTVLVRYFFYNTDSLDMGRIYQEKTARLSGFQRYNPLDRQGFYASLGNVGLAHNRLIYTPTVYKGYDFGLHAFDEYIFNEKNARYYLHNRPVSYISYFNGPRKEQLFRAMLSHKIFKAVTVAADFSLINSPGSYFRQKSDNRSLLLTGQYYTRDERLGIIANYTWNKLIIEENGGILNDSIFEQDLETDRALIDVNLLNSGNLLQEKGAFLNSYFYLSRNRAADSTGEKPRTFHAGRISYTLNYKSISQLYTDEDPRVDFYAPYTPVLDTNETHDSLHIRKIENSFSWSNMRLGESFEDKLIWVNFAFMHQYVQLTGYADRRAFTQLIPSADLRIRPFEGLSVGGHGHYVLGDFNNNGFLLKADGRLQVNLRKDIPGILEAEVGFASQEAGYFYNFYQSNHFRWDTSFRHQNYRWFGASLSVWDFKVGARYTSVGNYVYLGPNATPLQSEENIDILQLSWHQNVRWKVWNLDLDIYYQTASRSAIHVPALAGRGAFYATLSLFGNAAVLQPGIDAYYNTAYHSDAYMPALRSFYWQDEKKTGNYFYLDLFINLMIKRFRLFVQFQHLNSFWTPSRYYMVPHYPMQDAAFKWGLSWTFYD